MSLQGEILMRERTPEGVRESRRSFATLDELYALCLQVREPQLIEGLLLHGADERGQPRTLAFSFRSITAEK